MNYAMNDLCSCSNCAGQACRCGCQLTATAPVSEAQAHCVCGGTCACGAAKRCLCNEWTSY
jgi:hypothetical protein